MEDLMTKLFKSKNLFSAISFLTLLAYQATTTVQADSPPKPGEPAVTIENHCKQDIRLQGTNKIHIYTLGSLNNCPRADRKTEDWVTIRSGQLDYKWHTENGCAYIVEPEGTVKSPARFTSNNDVISCSNEFGWGICKCEKIR